MLEKGSTILSNMTQTKTKNKSEWTNRGKCDNIDPQVNINGGKVILIPIFKQFMETEVLRSKNQCEFQPKTPVERKETENFDIYVFC